MRFFFIALSIFIGTYAFAQEAQTERLTLKVGDKFEILGIKGKLYEVYGADRRDPCWESDKGEVTEALVAYVEFKYNRRKVSINLCNQQVQEAEGKPTKTHYKTEKFKGKDAVVGLALAEVIEGKKENKIVLEFVKEPLPEED
jgi:hypothetical protein